LSELTKSKWLVIPSAALSREKSAVPLSARNRFLADKPGFGMTSLFFWRKFHHKIFFASSAIKGF
jgi:hypothetical protein